MFRNLKTLSCGIYSFESFLSVADSLAVMSEGQTDVPMDVDASVSHTVSLVLIYE